MELWLHFYKQDLYAHGFVLLLVKIQDLLLNVWLIDASNVIGVKIRGCERLSRKSY